MHNQLKKKEIKKSLLIFLVLSMTFPLFIQSAKAGIIVGPPEPPANPHCRAQVRVHFLGVIKFTLFIQANGIVGEHYGGYKLIDYFYNFNDIDWDDFRLLFPILDRITCCPLWLAGELHYDLGGYQLLGYTQTIAFRIYDIYSGENFDFTLSARVHLWYGNDVNWNLTSGSQGVFDFTLEEVTIPHGDLINLDHGSFCTFSI